MEALDYLLAEEVGKLQAEVLAQAGYQRRSKAGFTNDTLAGELADVMVCVSILASSHEVDLGKAVAAKIEGLEARHQAGPVALPRLTSPVVGRRGSLPGEPRNGSGGASDS